jgi:hypothetical protein
LAGYTPLSGWDKGRVIENIMMTSRKTACVLAAICLYAAVGFLYAPVIPDRPFAYDEADYMWAGKQGLWANYTGEHAISLVEFVRKGLELSHNSGNRQSFSDYIRSSGDIDFYRHYHGPLYAYWLALLHDAGVQGANVFRGSGLLFHFATATLILFGVWAVFPSLPPVAGLLACALFVFNRAALTAASSITQHVLFTFFCVAALLACSMFLRNLQSKWFYISMALIGCAFCTVETSVLLLGAPALSMMVDYRRVREKWPTVKALAGLLGRGIGVFLLTILILWPMGILQLGVAKGFLGLIYIAVYRKTFSPLGPLGLWAAEFRVSPAEFVPLFAGSIAAFILWRGFAQRRELLPWLAFIGVFFLVTLKVTAPYTYYYAPLTASFAVATGVAAGILWNRWPWPGRAGLLIAITGSIVAMTIQFNGVLRELKGITTYESIVLRLIGEYPVEPGKQIYLPYQAVPMLHYYHPDIKTVGYDFDFPLARLADGVKSGDAAGIMFCEAVFCDALERRMPGFAARKTLLERPGPNGQPLYLVQLRKSGVL